MKTKTKVILHCVSTGGSLAMSKALIQETIQTMVNLPIIVPGFLSFEFLEGKIFMP